jgi:hypothetical protein
MYDFSPFHPLHDGFQKFTVIFGRVEKAENWPIFDTVLLEPLCCLLLKASAVTIVPSNNKFEACVMKVLYYTLNFFDGREAKQLNN